jgi:hypothetical protein
MTKPRAIHARDRFPSGCGSPAAPHHAPHVLCGARSAAVALTAAEVTCKTCLSWPELVKKAYGASGECFGCDDRHCEPKP